MRFKYYLILVQSIFFNQVRFTNTKAMVGEKVRQVIDGEFTFVVSIKVRNDANPEPEKDHGCTGVVVSKQDVLTVAHGFDRIPLDRIEIRAGSIDIRRGAKYYPTQLKTYDTWAKENKLKTVYPENDIAIMKVNKAFSPDINPVDLRCLPNDNFNFKEVVIAGWGQTMTGKPRYMETVALKVLPLKTCLERIEQLVHRKTAVLPMHICTVAEPYAFLRKGDSGGPLLYNNELIGINKATSPFPDDNLNPKKVNIHLNIHYYRHFIVDLILDSQMKC